jgi:hypothetical protein
MQGFSKAAFLDRWSKVRALVPLSSKDHCYKVDIDDNVRNTFFFFRKPSFQSDPIPLAATLANDPPHETLVYSPQRNSSLICIQDLQQLDEYLGRQVYQC